MGGLSLRTDSPSERERKQLRDSPERGTKRISQWPTIHPLTHPISAYLQTQLQTRPWLHRTQPSYHCALHHRVYLHSTC